MDNTDNEFDKIENAAADRRRQQDFDDLQNELSGIDVGRIPRFLSPEARALIAEKRTGKKYAAMTALDLALLNNPEFAAAYDRAMDTLSKAEDGAERVLVKLETQLTDLNSQMKYTEAEYQAVLDKAVKLQDGTAVFRDKNGAVWDMHGKRIDDDIASTLEWSGFEPSYEAFQEKRQTIADLTVSVQEVEDSIHEIRVYQTDILGNVRADLTNPDHSGRVEDVKAAEDRILDRMPEVLRNELEPDVLELDSKTPSGFTVAAPDLGG